MLHDIWVLTLYYIKFHQKPQTKSAQHKVTTSSPITKTTTIFSKILCLTPEAEDEMETITASVEEVSLSENTPDEQPPSETKTPTKEFESTPGKEDQGLLFSPPAILPELSARRTLVYEVPKGRRQ